MSGVTEHKEQIFKDTAGLAPAATSYLNNGYYTNALPGTKPYFE